jgi:hypothetical protein
MSQRTQDMDQDDFSVFVGARADSLRKKITVSELSKFESRASVAGAKLAYQELSLMRSLQ